MSKFKVGDGVIVVAEWSCYHGNRGVITENLSGTNLPYTVFFTDLGLDVEANYFAEDELELTS